MTHDGVFIASNDRTDSILLFNPITGFDGRYNFAVSDYGSVFVFDLDSPCSSLKEIGLKNSTGGHRIHDGSAVSDEIDTAVLTISIVT